MYEINSSIGGGSFGTRYSKDGKSGYEDDNIYGIMPPSPGGISCKMTTFVDGVEVSGMTVPAGTTPGSGSCPSVSVIVGAGATVVVPPGTKWHATADVSGFDGWKWHVTDAEGEVPSGTYIGPTSFSFGGSASISYWQDTVNPPVEPPTDPTNPTTPTTPVTIPGFKPSVNLNLNFGKKNPAIIGGWRNFPLDKTLFIENLWEGCSPDSNAGGWALTLMPGSDEYLDGNDLRYENIVKDSINSMVTSLLVRKNSTTLMGMIDARDILPEKLTIGLAFDSKTGNAVSFDSPKRNHLSFSYPVKYGNSNVARPFDGKIISIGYDGSTRWDVYKIITMNNGVFEMLPVKGDYLPKVAYASLTLYSGFSLTDVDLNGKVDSDDYNFVRAMLGFEGPTPADVWGPLGLGMPDGRVDSNDVSEVYKVLPPEEKAKVIPPENYQSSLTSRVPLEARMQVQEYLASN